MGKHYKPHEFAQLVGVSVKTLQRWDTSGRLKAYRAPSNRRYYTHQQYLTYIGADSPPTHQYAVIYARVSNRAQKDDLANQVQFLREFANARGWIIDQVIEDIGSGLNYRRKHWNALLVDALDGKVSRIVVAHKDRFIRFGFEWFAELLKNHGVDLVVVHNEQLSPQEELVQDLVSIIHVFSSRIYGLRKYKTEIKEDPDVTRLQNRD